jgi:hypothetical protein
MGNKVTGIPGFVVESAATTVNAARAAFTQSVLSKQGLNIVDEPLLLVTDEYHLFLPFSLVSVVIVR